MRQGFKWGAISFAGLYLLTVVASSSSAESFSIFVGVTLVLGFIWWVVAKRRLEQSASVRTGLSDSIPAETKENTPTAVIGFRAGEREVESR
jgi:hypothetical protein